IRNGARSPGRELMGEGVYTEAAGLRQALTGDPCKLPQSRRKSHEISIFRRSFGTGQKAGTHPFGVGCLELVRETLTLLIPDRHGSRRASPSPHEPQRRVAMPRMLPSRPKSRRNFLKLAGASALMVPVGLAMPRLSRAATRPLVTHGLQSGDIGTNHGVVWARTDRPARATFEVATTEGFRD